MNTYIVNEPSKNIRTIARQTLKGNWKSAVLAVVIYAICIAVPTVIIIALFGGFSEEVLMSEELMMPGEGLSTVYSILVTGAFTFGISVYFLDLIRESKSDIGQVFSGFGLYFKTLALYVVMSIFIILWTLLLIVPGIIAAFRYSQAFYIMADDPSKGVMQCLRESKALMKGNKAKYFCLQLSFIGWYVLIYGVIIICSGISLSMSLMMPGEASFVIEMVILAVGMIAAVIGVMILLPYVMAATTVFYEMVNGNLRPESDELPPLGQLAPETVVPELNDTPKLFVDNNNNNVNEDKIEF